MLLPACVYHLHNAEGLQIVFPCFKASFFFVLSFFFNLLSTVYACVIFVVGIFAVGEKGQDGCQQ